MAAAYHHRGRVSDAVFGNQQPTRRQAYRFIILLVAVSAIGAGAVAIGVSTSSATSTVAMDSLTIPDANETVNGNVSDVSVSTDVSYAWSVMDAERVVITLKAGPTKDDLEPVTFKQISDPAGEASGTMQLAGSLTEVSHYTAEDFDPAYADTKTTDLVVAVEMEVRRPNDPAVTATATEPVSVTLSDGNTLTATVGGSGEISVAT